MRLSFVAIILDPPHGPVSHRFTLEVEGDGEQGEESHNSRVHSVCFHVTELGGSRYQSGEIVVKNQFCILPGNL